ncbi:hypothetical protein ACFQ0B_80450 [Nonomuraea thailandensis]
MDDLLLAAALRPQLAADYGRAEAELGHRFTHKLSMGRSSPACAPPACTLGAIPPPARP